jgi:hypothetical protein
MSRPYYPHGKSTQNPQKWALERYRLHDILRYINNIIRGIKTFCNVSVTVTGVTKAVTLRKCID